MVGKRDFSRKGEVQERIGYCLYRSAFQADTQEEFKQRMRRATKAYEKTHEFYAKLANEQKAARMFRCDAMIAYIGYWLASEMPEKKRLLTECWRLTKEALKAFKEAGSALEYGKTYNELSSSAFLRYVHEWNFQAGQKIIKEAVECGEQAVNLLSSVADSRELARAYVKAAFYLSAFGYHFNPDMDEKERYYRKGHGYWEKACELSEEAALLELASTSGSSGDDFGWSFDEIIVNFEKALGLAKKAKDNYMIGTALDWLTYANAWKSTGIDDPDKRAEMLQRALQYAEDAKQHFSSISFVSPRGVAAWTGAPKVWYYWLLGRWETDPRKKRDLLGKAVMYGTQAVKEAESTGYPRIREPHHILSLSLAGLARIEANFEEKRRLLEEALEYRKECVRVTEQFCVFEYWNLGVNRNLLAGLKAELSRFEKDSEKRKNMLEEAISLTEHGLRLMITETLYWEKMGELAFFNNLGRSQFSYGEFLIRLYGLTNNDDHQRKAIKAFEEAAESFQKLNWFSRMAECHWKVAESYDALGEHPKAAENFTLASTNYVSAAEKIPQLENFYKDHARYMQAWSEIEKARHHHRRQDYGTAKEHFEKAANLHKSLKQWSYLAPNYSAWTLVEHAEELSRKEQGEEAIQAFEQAAQLFKETKKSLQTQRSRIEGLEEKQMATNMLKATDLRHEYCIARIALEEAKILDKKGDHYFSSEKYGSAAETFEKIGQALESKRDLKEFKFLISLSQAWQKMTLAEAEASTALYVEASKLFEEAKEFSPNEKAKMLMLGHSRFCKALEAGTRFEDTRDTTMYSAAKKHMEAAANYYLKAGFKNASEYARATHRLFDAYMYAHKAETETDPRKKAQFYQMAEKLLQTSAGSYMKAKHPEKSQEVQRLLESVKEERQLALSLTEVLHAPTITSTTTSFSTPTPTHEQAVGLERFEHADIQANLILRVKEVKVGEDVSLAIELVNAGKAPALPIKVDEVVPEGFDIKEVPETYVVEDSFINMKGKRLNPLKTEDVKMVIKPRSKGTFVVKPRVLYIDETGKYKSHEPEPVTITVKELGIKGWIKGER